MIFLACVMATAIYNTYESGKLSALKTFLTMILSHLTVIKSSRTTLETINEVYEKVNNDKLILKDDDALCADLKRYLGKVGLDSNDGGMFMNGKFVDIKQV